MRITLNGKPQILESETTISGLVSQLGLDVRKVAVEHNLTIVPRSLYDQTALAEGDSVELVHFIGGG